METTLTGVAVVVRSPRHRSERVAVFHERLHLDQRSLGTYTPISDRALHRGSCAGLLEGWTDDQVPDRQILIAQPARMAATAAFCWERLLHGRNRELGPQLTSTQIFQTSPWRKFDTAVTAAQADRMNPVGDGDILISRLVGRARAELDAGDNAARS